MQISIVTLFDQVFLVEGRAWWISIDLTTQHDKPLKPTDTKL